MTMQDKMDEPIDVNVEVEGFNENVDLVPAPKPVTTSPASKSPVAANSGAKRNGCKVQSTLTMVTKVNKADQHQNMVTWTELQSQT